MAKSDTQATVTIRVLIEPVGTEQAIPSHGDERKEELFRNESSSA